MGVMMSTRVHCTDAGRRDRLVAILRSEGHQAVPWFEERNERPAGYLVVRREHWVYTTASSADVHRLGAGYPLHGAIVQTS